MSKKNNFPEFEAYYKGSEFNLFDETWDSRDSLAEMSFNPLTPSLALNMYHQHEAITAPAFTPRGVSYYNQLINWVKAFQSGLIRA